MGESILDIPLERLTPGMKQYREVKEEHPDCLVMLRMGDFYEMFYDDAITASKALEITLTSRGQGDKKAPLAGIPFHALEPYLSKLVKNGFKVAIVEQLEDPKLAKGLVKRGLVRIVTPGTVIEPSMLQEKENNFLIALTQNGDHFALSFCDISTGEFFSTYLDSEQSLVSELTRLNPRECIIPVSLQVNKELMDIIKKKHCFVNSLNDDYFNPKKAEEVLLEKFGNIDAFGLPERNIAVSGALLRYLLETQKNNLSYLQKITLKSTHDKMLLDASTLVNLEILKNIRDGSARGSLISVLDKTCTPMGGRLLKQWIKEPLLNKKVIESRLRAVADLLSQTIVTEELREQLCFVQDLERLISRVSYGNANPRDLLALRNSLQKIPLIKEQLDNFRTELLKTIGEVHDLSEVSELISQSICEDAPITIREGGIINNGFHQELDQLRMIKKDSRKYLQELEEKEKEKTGISTLHLGFTKVFGYFIEVTKKNLHLVPSYYIRKQTTVNSERYITEELKLEEEKILGAEEKINQLEYELFQQLIRQVSSKTVDIQETAKKIAVLDVLLSLAKVSLENNYVCPELVDEPVIEIIKGRHPVIEKMEQQFISNDVFLNQGEMMIITGSNMSGKSTVMRQTALIQLMAQIGCFIPAEKARLGVVDRIFTRVGAFDDLSSGQSTFMVEMQETALILNNATAQSLIILDEIGRGTSTFDGVSIAWSIGEHIYNKIKAKTMFATHYHVLNKLADHFSRIKNYNMAVKEVGHEIIMLHKLISGATDQSHGMHVAKLAGVPTSVIERAREIQQILEQDDEMVRKVKAKKLEEQMSLQGFEKN
ncbi:DNA mismatch repair protein MutS [Candidatus Woesearchaeota archaeon]|nr:DNA mismatch repair protein MutS [Candidatus Woesearchaeota archaeon]